MNATECSHTKNIGAFVHPRNGEYFIWHNTDTNCYGITRPTKTAPPHCAYGSLASLFKAKDI